MASEMSAEHACPSMSNEMPAATEVDSSESDTDSGDEDEPPTKRKKLNEVQKRDMKKRASNVGNDHSPDCDFSTTQTVMEQKLFLKNKVTEDFQVDHSLFKIIQEKGRSGNSKINL